MKRKRKNKMDNPLSLDLFLLSRVEKEWRQFWKKWKKRREEGKEKKEEGKKLKNRRVKAEDPPPHFCPSTDFSSLSVMTMRPVMSRGLWCLIRVSLWCGWLVWNARLRELLACTGWIVFIRSLISSTTRVGCSSSATFDRVHADLRAMLVSSNVRGCREEPGVFLLDYSKWILPSDRCHDPLSFDRLKKGRELVDLFSPPRFITSLFLRSSYLLCR